MSDHDPDSADVDDPAGEYDELVHLIVDGAWNPGDVVCTSQGVTWQFRAVPYTSDFPETMERLASGPATKAASAVERWRTVHSR